MPLDAPRGDCNFSRLDFADRSVINSYLCVVCSGSPSRSRQRFDAITVPIENRDSGAFAYKQPPAKAVVSGAGPPD